MLIGTSGCAKDFFHSDEGWLVKTSMAAVAVNLKPPVSVNGLLLG